MNIFIHSTYQMIYSLHIYEMAHLKIQYDNNDLQFAYNIHHR